MTAFDYQFCSSLVHARVCVDLLWFEPLPCFFRYEQWRRVEPQPPPAAMPNASDLRFLSEDPEVFMNDGSTLISFSVPAHPDEAQAARLRQQAAHQHRVRADVWRHLRTRLEAVDAHGLIQKPAVPAARTLLTQLLPPVDIRGSDQRTDVEFTVRNQAERAVRDELARLKAMPEWVRLGDLQPPDDLDQLTLAGRPCFPADTQLLIGDGVTVPVDAFALPMPFLQALQAMRATRLVEWRAQIEQDFATLLRSGGQLSPAETTAIRRHLVQYLPWCVGPLQEVDPVPGVRALRATLGLVSDRTGTWRWCCRLDFSLTSVARATWFPERQSGSIAGVDPGCAHPLTWATDTEDVTLSPALSDLTSGEMGPEGRRALWERHQIGYRRAWAELLCHDLVRIEETNWRTLELQNPRYIRLAREGYLWTWLDHFEALTRLTGTRVEWVPPHLTSKTCSACKGAAAHRPRGGVFICGLCGIRLPTDVNAARNIRLHEPIRSHRIRLAPQVLPQWIREQENPC